MRTSAFHRKSIAAEQEEYPLSLRHAPLSGKPAYCNFVSDRLREERISRVGGWLVVCERSWLLQPVGFRPARPAKQSPRADGRDRKNRYVCEGMRVCMYLVIRLDVQLDLLSGKGTDSVEVDNQLAFAIATEGRLSASWGRRTTTHLINIFEVKIDSDCKVFVEFKLL